MFQQPALKDEIFVNKHFSGLANFLPFLTKIYVHKMFQKMSSTKFLEIDHLWKFMSAKLKEFAKFSHCLSDVEIFGRNILYIGIRKSFCIHLFSHLPKFSTFLFVWFLISWSVVTRQSSFLQNSEGFAIRRRNVRDEIKKMKFRYEF